jgi:hypothetical protein
MYKVLSLAFVSLMSVNAAMNQSPAFPRLMEEENTDDYDYSELRIEDIKWYFACYRGSLQGFEKGYYKKFSFKIPDKCLGEHAV